MKKKVVIEKPKEDDRNIDPIFDKAPKMTGKEQLKEKYMSLPIQERIEFMKGNNKNVMVSKFVVLKIVVVGCSC